MSQRFVCGLWLFSALVAAPAARGGTTIDYLDPPQGAFVDDWMIVSLDGEKSGYVHSTMSREGNTIATRSLTYFKIGRANQTIEIRMVQSTKETLAGKPLSFDNTTLTSAIETRTRGTISEGRAEIVTSQFGFDSTQSGKVPAAAKMTWGMFRATIEHGLTKGTSYDLEIYEPMMLIDGTLTAHISIGDKETIQHRGKPRLTTKVTTSMKMGFGTVDSVGFVDDNGHALRVETSIAGMAMTLLLADRESALKDFSAPEFFMDTLVKVNRAIDRDSAKVIKYKLKVVGVDQKVPQLPTTPAQNPGERTARSVVVTVRRLDREALRDAEPVAASESMRAFLAASPSINAKDDAIVRMAAEAAGDTTKPYAVADKLRVYVSKIITEKNLTIGFATASEVCRNRAGDCTEHAVLLAALGRARGIPSRIVVGLAYVPSFVGLRNVFGFHMWTQFHIGGEWVDFDAALRESDCSPARIALATSALKDASIGEIAMAIMDVVRGLQIEILSVESR